MSQMSHNLMRIKVHFKDINEKHWVWLLITEDIKTIRDLKNYLKRKYAIKECFDCFVDQKLSLSWIHSDIPLYDWHSVCLLRDNDVLTLRLNSISQSIESVVRQSASVAVEGCVDSNVKVVVKTMKTSICPNTYYMFNPIVEIERI